jgi:putative transposase
MDEDHLIAAFRYVSLNPVRARLVSRAEDWPWSSVRAHVAGRDDGVTRVKPVLDRVTDFAGLVAHDGDRRSRQADRRFAPRNAPADRWETPSSSPISNAYSNAPSPVAPPAEDPTPRQPVNPRFSRKPGGFG